MSEHLTWWVNDRNPSISDQLTTAGVPVDLSAATVQFKMRGPLDGVNNATVKVNAPVSSKDASGNWRYDWGATDLNTVGEYLCWLEVTVSSKVQTLWESLIEVRDHTASQLYVEPEQLKATLEMSGTSFADQDILRAVGAASRMFDALTDRRYYKDADATQVRYYTPRTWREVLIDDLVQLTSLKIDRSGQGSFTETWTLNTDFILTPLNAPSDGWPYDTIVTRQLSTFAYFDSLLERSIQVTGQFGWPSVPEDVKAATTILATRLLRRMREAPFGVVSLGIDMAAAVRISKTDPDVGSVVDTYSRNLLI